jgi:hypothetical protein
MSSKMDYKKYLLSKLYAGTWVTIRRQLLRINRHGVNYDGKSYHFWINQPYFITKRTPSHFKTTPEEVKAFLLIKPRIDILAEECRLLDLFITKLLNAYPRDKVLAWFPLRMGGQGLPCDFPEMETVRKRILLGDFS